LLKGKTILLGVTGGIAAYKAAALASALVKLHAQCRRNHDGTPSVYRPSDL
jgi:phosphopantothenoylcysteine synthetase/decarboxylase